MADRQRVLMRRKEKKEREVAEAAKQNVKELKKEGKAPAEEEKVEANGEVPVAAEEGAAANATANAATNAATNAAANAAVANGESGENKVEPMELPPFEIITGDRIDPFFYKFQFKNVEYSSGRNKTFLCYLIDKHNKYAADGIMRGYLEDEHIGSHAEEAFFIEILPDYDPVLKYTVTWYVSSSPCSACAAKIVEVLKARKNLKLAIFSARLFEWEEPEIQAGLKALHDAGCKLRVMKPLDFSYTWDTFVEHDDQPFNLWEDCKDNYEYYQDKLAEILQ